MATISVPENSTWGGLDFNVSASGLISNLSGNHSYFVYDYYTYSLIQYYDDESRGDFFVYCYYSTNSFDPNASINLIEYYNENGGLELTISDVAITYSDLLQNSFDLLSGDDFLNLSDFDDIANGAAGDDVIWGWYGNDILKGQGGNDLIWGGGGSDYLNGGAGNDVVEYLGPKNEFIVVGHQDRAVVIDLLYGAFDVVSDTEIISFSDTSVHLNDINFESLNSDLEVLLDEVEFVPYPGHSLESSSVSVDQDFGFFTLNMDYYWFDQLLDGVTPNLEPSDQLYAIKSHSADENISSYGTYDWKSAEALTWLSLDGKSFISVFDSDIKELNFDAVEDAITFAVSDGYTWSAETFTVDILPVNHAPTITTSALTAIDEDSSYSYTISASDIDVGDTVTLSAQTLPSWLSFDASSGNLTGTPGNNDVGDHSVVLVASDGTVNVNQSFTISVSSAVIPIETEPNDSFATAYDVNSKSSQRLDEALASLSGLRISSPLEGDMYLIKIEDGESFDLEILFNSDEADLDLVIYDQYRNYLDGSFFGVDSEILSVPQPGTYYLAVYSYDGASADYTLRASNAAGIAEDIYEDNDTLATAYDFGVQNTSVSGYFTDLTIDKAYDDDYFAFTIDTAADLDITIAFDHDKGDLDVELLDSSGNWLAGSSTTADEETISVKGLAAGDYYFAVYGYEGATSPSYSVTSTLTLDPLPDNADAYERNDSFETAYGLGSISAAQTAVTSSNFHSSSDEDFYSFYLNGSQSLGIEAIFAHSDGDLDIELLDSNGNWIDASTTGSDNEYLSLSGLAAGSYTLNAYGYDGATVDNYSVRFVEENFENWWDTYDNWWDWQEADQASYISADSYEDNDTFANAANFGSISTSTDFNNLTINSSGDDDWFKFNYDASTRLDVSIGFDGSAADLDMDLYDANWNWIDGSYGVEGSEEVSLVGLASGEYYLSIYEYNYGTVADYDLRFEVAAGAAIADLNDQYEPNDSFADATDMGDATGEGSVTELTLTSGDVDWYKAYFPNNGTPDQYLSALFDHQDGDIDIELYDSSGDLIRSSESSTDNELIYLSDITGGSYYYLKVYQYGESNFQEYSIDYSFPVEVSTATISADSLEGSSGNEIFSAASTVGLVSQTNDLTIHSTTDTDFFSFTTRNLSSSASEVSISYDAGLGTMNLSLWAVDIGGSAPTLVAATASGTGREVISFDNFLAGTYYLQALGQEGALIPDYSLSMNVTEVEGSGAQSDVISADQFDLNTTNDTSQTATDLGTLSTTLSVADLSIHSETDRDFLKFGTTYAGETQINLAFSHAAGDIDASLKNSGGTEVAYGMSGDDNETLTFQSSIDESYTLEVYGYNGETNRDYDLTITPKQLSSRRDDYETNDSSTQAATVRDARASFDNLTLHNASDQDWFKFTIADTAGASNKVQVTNLLGANAELKIYSSDGTTQVGSTVSITDGSGSVDTSGFASGDYYAVVSSTASSSAAASEQLSNYKLYVDQVSGATSTQNASWTVMVYVAGDNDLAFAAVDDINEMEGVVLPENVNVVTLTDLSGDYDTSAGWTDTRQGAITPDPNGYNTYGLVGGSWAGPADALTSDLVSVGEKNMGDPTTLTNFIDWSTTNHAADNYALVIWDHGGGLEGIAWDYTDGHDNLTISEIKAGIENSAAFSSSNSLDLIGFDACLMQTYEVGLEMAPIADVMVASQETEPGDGWDYQAFLQSLADNPYASAKTLGGYIVDSYDAWYDSSAETLSSVDLTKFQSIDTAINFFNNAAQNAPGSDWLTIDDAAEDAWSSAAWDYGWAGEERDLGQFFEYISENASDSSLKTAATGVLTAIENAVVDNSSRQGLSGIQAGLLDPDAYFWSGDNLIGKSGSAWGQFQALYDTADRSVRSASAENLTPDYSETSDALGRSSQGNNTSLTAFELGTVTNATLVDNLTLHNAQDIDWYSFTTPAGLENSGNTIKLNTTNTAPLKATLYDSNRVLIAEREGLESSFDITASSSYLIKIESRPNSETNREQTDVAYKVDFDLVASDTTQEIVVADLAEGSSSNDVVAKATELAFTTESDTTLANLSLSLTEGDQDWFEISAGRISEQSPNLFSVVIDDATLTSKEDVVIELADASGTVLATSIAIGGNETVIFEDYTSDIFINVKSGSGKVLDYKLDLHHADYDVDGSGSVNSATDGEAILASLFSNTTISEVAGNLFEDASAGATSLQSFMNDYTTTLLDVDGDGVTKASTDGVIIDAYIAGASADLLLPLISSDSPITTSDELLTHLLEIA